MGSDGSQPEIDCVSLVRSVKMQLYQRQNYTCCGLFGVQSLGFEQSTVE